MASIRKEAEPNPASTIPANKLSNFKIPKRNSDTTETAEPTSQNPEISVASKPPAEHVKNNNSADKDLQSQQKIKSFQMDKSSKNVLFFQQTYLRRKSLMSDPSAEHNQKTPSPDSVGKATQSDKSSEKLSSIDPPVTQSTPQRHKTAHPDKEIKSGEKSPTIVVEPTQLTLTKPPQQPLTKPVQLPDTEPAQLPLAEENNTEGVIDEKQDKLKPLFYVSA